MFRKLRNSLLMTNMIIITALVIGCLSAIYITTYSYVKNDVDLRLKRAVDMYTETLTRPVRHPENMMPQYGTPMSPPRENSPRLPEPNGRERRTDIFSSEIAVYCDKLGNIISSQSVFSPEDFDYSHKLKEIATSLKDSGSTTLDVDSWAYRRVEYDDGYIIAFTKNESERNMLFTLMIILSIVAVISIGVSFLISRFSANRSIQPIEAAYNKQKQFVADASHELRTPLASISANTDVLLSKPDSTIAEEGKWITYIKEETDRMTRLTNDLLSLAKTDTEDNKPILFEISFSDVAEDAVLEIEASAFEQGVQINTDIAENIKVEATQNGLKQIVLILLDNAIKYSDKGEAVVVSLKAENGKAVFEVKNPGSINAEDLPHIFERFYRADKSRSSGGYGLGLSIAKSLCQTFNGRIEVVSENGLTIFSVILNKS